MNDEEGRDLSASEPYGRAESDTGGRVEEFATLTEPASERFADRVNRAVDRVEAGANIGDFTGGVVKSVLLEMAALLLGLFAVRQPPREEGGE